MAPEVCLILDPGIAIGTACTIAAAAGAPAPVDSATGAGVSMANQASLGEEYVGEQAQYHGMIIATRYEKIMK